MDMSFEPLLKEQRPCDIGKKTLVLDLDETLVHSTFQPSNRCQYVVPVEIEGNIYNVYVYRRPGALEFIRHMSSMYEIVVYTASLKKVCVFEISAKFTFLQLFIYSCFFNI